MSEPQLDARLLYDHPRGVTSALFLGHISQISDAAPGLRSALNEVKYAGGSNPRVEVRDQSGEVIYLAKVPGVA